MSNPSETPKPIASLCLPYPLRRDYMAQIIIPRDMTQAEADRLCAFVMALAVSEPDAKEAV